jgi:hypothetical protein
MKLDRTQEPFGSNCTMSAGDDDALSKIPARGASDDVDEMDLAF